MPTQQQIAEHIDLDQSAVSRFVEKADVDYRSASMDEIRIAYIRHLREMAAGRSSGTGIDLVAERAMTERVDREIKLLTLAEKKGQLVNAAQLEAEYGRLVDAFRSELLGLPERMAQKIRAIYGADVERGRGAGTAPGGTATGDALDLLADMLSRVDGASGELAAYADAARIAGHQCERSYDALIGDQRNALR